MTLSRVLSLCCCYPAPAEPNQGIFVQHRLRHLARHAEWKVLAPVPVFDYANGFAGKSWLGPRGIPSPRMEDGLEVYRPHWVYPPFGDFTNAFFLFTRIWPAAKRIHSRFPFQLLDIHFAFPEGVAGAMVARRLDIPYTITLRGNEQMHSRYPMRLHWMRWALRGASRIFAVSEALRKFAVTHGAAEERTRTIPNGIDRQVFHPRPIEESRRKHGFSADALHIVTAGHLIEAKGHQEIVRALHLLRNSLAQRSLAGLHLREFLPLREGPPALCELLTNSGEKTEVRGQQSGCLPASPRKPIHLHIAGVAGRQGRYEGTLHSLVRELNLQNRVFFLGRKPQHELAELMSAADLFVLASHSEGWPNVVQEAMACGTPAVATEVGAVPDMIPDARYGLIVPPKDPARLAKAIGEALTTPWSRDAIAAWGQRRSWDAVARDVFAEMNQAVSEKFHQQAEGLRSQQVRCQ